MAIYRRKQLTDLAQSATRAVEDNTNVILGQDHAIQRNTHDAMGETALWLLGLPVELWTEIFKYLSKYSDLKALRLVSKRVSNIATPRQYYEVDLKKDRTQEDVLMVVRIKALLAGPFYSDLEDSSIWARINPTYGSSVASTQKGFSHGVQL